MLSAAAVMLFPAIMAFAASSDLLTMTISNRLCATLVILFLSLAVLVGMPAVDMLWHAGAGLAVLVVGFVFFARGWIGGGDAKLAAATALWLGFGTLTEYLLYASLLGGALTMFLLLCRQYPLPARLARMEWVLRLHEPRGGVPYGIALAAAAMLVYPHTGWMNAYGL
jgi:prepilin peptidase CpaA